MANLSPPTLSFPMGQLVISVLTDNPVGGTVLTRIPTHLLFAGLILLAAVPTSAQTAPAPALQDTHRAQVQAAVDNATAKLKDQILQMELGHDITVQKFIDRTNGNDALTTALNNAQQIGGPRWVDDHTCQVRLEIRGSVLADLLIHQAQTNPDKTPLPQAALAERVKQWNAMTFFAIGSSANGEAIENARPHFDVGAWADVPAPARKKAVAAARHDAVQHVLDDIKPISLWGNVLVQDALARPTIGDRVDQWINHQPIIKVEFQSDLQVEVTLSVPTSALESTLQSAVSSDQQFTQNASIDWGRVQKEITLHVGSAVGRSSAAPQGGPSSLPAVVLPIEPPDWIDQLIEAEATATGTGSRLKVARAAEVIAVGKLRDQFLTMKISPDSTLGDAAHADPRINEAVDRAMKHTRTFKVDYRADGSVVVRVDLDLRAAWDEVKGNP
jgi:hypothetical protein